MFPAAFLATIILSIITNIIAVWSIGFVLNPNSWLAELSTNTSSYIISGLIFVYTVWYLAPNNKQKATWVAIAIIVFASTIFFLNAIINKNVISMIGLPIMCAASIAVKLELDKTK